jgi:hypothetical protein
METLLLKTGWTFQDTARPPLGRDRRGWPRRSNDRRRWWTDGAVKHQKNTEQRVGETAEPDREPHVQPSLTSEK